MAIATCKNCDKEFRFYPSQSRGIYCSNACQGAHKVREAIESGIYTRSNAMTYFKQTTEYKCSDCGISEWNNQPLTLQVDHIDGNNSNNVIENLRYLCPNCHTQTDTWGVRSASDEGKQRMREAAKLGRAIQLGKVPEGTKLER